MIRGFRCKYDIDEYCESDKCDKCKNHPMYQQGRADMFKELKPKADMDAYKQGKIDTIEELKEHFSFKNIVIDEPAETADIRGGRFYIDITSALNRVLYDYFKSLEEYDE